MSENKDLRGFLIYLLLLGIFCILPFYTNPLMLSTLIDYNFGTNYAGSVGAKASLWIFVAVGLLCVILAIGTTLRMISVKNKFITKFYGDLKLPFAVIFLLGGAVAFCKWYEGKSGAPDFFVVCYFALIGFVVCASILGVYFARAVKSRKGKA